MYTVTESGKKNWFQTSATCWADSKQNALFISGSGQVQGRACLEYRLTLSCAEIWCPLRKTDI